MLIFSNSVLADDFFGQVKTDLFSPFQSDSVNVFYIGGGVTLVSLLFKEQIKNKLQPDISEDRPLKKSSKYFELMGRTIPNALYFIFMSSDYLINNDKKSKDRAELMLKASIYSGLVTDLSKYAFNEKRPSGGSYSFPSGHTTEAFAFASIIAMEHSIFWGVGAGLMAIGTGISRMNDNSHYLHDVIAGATIGTMYGVSLYNLNQKKIKDESSKEIVWFVIPTNGGGQVNFAFNF